MDMRKLPQATVNRDCRAKHPGETLILPGRHSSRLPLSVVPESSLEQHLFLLDISHLSPKDSNSKHQKHLDILNHCKLLCV